MTASFVFSVQIYEAPNRALVNEQLEVVDCLGRPTRTRGAPGRDRGKGTNASGTSGKGTPPDVIDADDGDVIDVEEAANDDPPLQPPPKRRRGQEQPWGKGKQQRTRAKGKGKDKGGKGDGGKGEGGKGKGGYRRPR